MLRGFLRADEEHRNIPTVALPKDRIVIYVDLSQNSAEFSQEGRDGSLSFVAKVTARTSVERDVEWAASG